MQRRVGSVLQHHDRRARTRPRAEAPKRLRLTEPRKLPLVVHAPLQAVPELRGVVQVSRLPRPPQSGGHGGALPPRQGVLSGQDRRYDPYGGAGCRASVFQTGVSAERRRTVGLGQAI
jgi:hypothetical protein